MTQPRSPKPSIKFVDEYCAIYQNVTAYGVIEDMTFPLTFQIYKPREKTTKSLI
ncbi:MAG: hypothetical protein V7L23_02975 [Nostoc sp.]|uniref:hypothetical protein n=1 Tax=Nostoc sp. TaxID=1180 RepID=UPI002FF2785C